MGYPLRLSPRIGDDLHLGVIVANIASHSSPPDRIHRRIRRKRGYNFLLCNSDNQLKKQTEYLDLMIKKQVDGLLIVPVELEDDTLRIWSRKGSRSYRSTVTSRTGVRRGDVRHRARSVSGHHYLSQQGYQRIAVISGPLSHSTGRERMAGFRKALEDNDLPILDHYIKVGGLKTVAGYQPRRNSSNRGTTRRHLRDHIRKCDGVLWPFTTVYVDP